MEREALLEYKRQWYKNNKSKSKEYYRENADRFRRHQLKNRYGITPETYNLLLDGQNFCCAVCDSPEYSNGLPLCVDHDHKTGWVRGLLCKMCNTALGVIDDSRERLHRMDGYLKLHNREEATDGVR